MAQQGIGRLNVLDLQIQIRRLPKPVVAMVAGYAIGGGHVLHVVCDLTIAADNARFGQTGPKVGSLRRRLRLGPAGPHRRPEEGARDLVPVPAVRRRSRRSTWASSTRSCRSADLEDETVAWCRRDAASCRRWRCACSRRRCNAADDGLAGIQQLAGDATLLFYMTEEAQEGRDAYVEKRTPDFAQFPKRP